MIEQLVAQLVGPTHRRRIVGQVDHQLLNLVVDREPKLVVGVGGQIEQVAGGYGVQAIEHDVVHRVGHPPRRLGVQTGAQRLPVDLEHLTQAPQDHRQHVLVTALGDDQLEHPGRRRAGGGRAQATYDGVLDHVAHLVVAHGVEDAGSDGQHLAGHPFGVDRLGHPGAHPGRHLSFAQALGDALGGEEVVGDERPQPGADVVLAFLDDRRVRDRDAHRVLEERGDGKPVGQTAHHARLGGGSHVGHPPGSVVAGDRRGDEHGGGDEEQTDRNRLHPAQFGPPSHLIAGERE